MGRINVGRVIIGGLVAGVVANALDFVTFTYLMKAEMDDMTQRLNLSVEVMNGSAAMTTFIVGDFIWGLLLVFTYAAMRPRFGPGPKTAVISGVTLWAAVCIMFAGMAAMGVYTQQAFIKSSALTLVSTLITSWVGGTIYQEKA